MHISKNDIRYQTLAVVTGFMASLDEDDDDDVSSSLSFLLTSFAFFFFALESTVLSLSLDPNPSSPPESPGLLDSLIVDDGGLLAFIPLAQHWSLHFGSTYAGPRWWTGRGPQQPAFFGCWMMGHR